jgi:hypothetical protein
MKSVGHSTLNKFETAPRFNSWMFSQYGGAIRWGKVWELGSGIGNMSNFYLAADLLCLSEYEPKYCEELKHKFGANRNVVVEPLNLENLDIDRFRKYNFDTIVSTNVIEHVENDHKAVREITTIMHNDSVMITLVPAHPWLYNNIDRGLGHFRRYTKSSLRFLFEQAGQEVISLKYFNRASVFGWALRSMLGTSEIKESDVSGIERLVPFLKMEKYLPLPFGVSLIAVTRKKVKA